MRGEVLEALREVVGQENLSTDPAVLDGYTYQPWAELLTGERFMPFRPEAVVLPGSTEEVQAVVRLCNRHGLRFKAHSTGWGFWSAAGGERTILLDLRRMNRILEVNEEDMYAVVEPYVTWAQLQAEVMRRGLNCCTIGAGSGTSVLASCTSMFGEGYNSLLMGRNARNVLAVEWVLPEGEVLRMGSLGQGAGWICGDGPGPSLRGIMRGYYGAMGGLGVFTKCAVRLYHWGGPPELPTEGLLPAEERLEPYPERVELYYACFESCEKRDEALFRVGEAEIGYAGGFMERGILTLGLGVDNRNSVEIRRTIGEAIPSATFMVLLVGNSRREFEYQKKVMERILEETGGWNIPFLQDPSVRDPSVILLLKGGSLPARAVFGLCGSFWNDLAGNIASRLTLSRLDEEVVRIKKRYVEEGKVADDLGEGGWGCLMDQAHHAYKEHETLYDPNDSESVRAILDMEKEINEAVISSKLFVPAPHLALFDVLEGKPPHTTAGALMNDYHLWGKRIKRAFDPNCASDPSAYIWPE